MNFPVTGTTALMFAGLFGFIFGVLLHRGGVVNYNVIVNQFRLKDFTVLKVMLMAIVVGGIGVMILASQELANYHIKPADMLGVALGAAIFGVGMVLYGYCPGTGVAAIGTGSVHALVGGLGMIAGGVLYAFSFSWVRDNILTVASLGKKRLPELVGLPDYVLFVVLTAIALIVFMIVERVERKQRPRAAAEPPKQHV